MNEWMNGKLNEWINHNGVINEWMNGELNE